MNRTARLTLLAPMTLLAFGCSANSDGGPGPGGKTFYALKLK